MFGLGVPELLLILGVVILLFGPSRLPTLGRSIGEGIGALRDGLRGRKVGTSDNGLPPAD